MKSNGNIWLLLWLTFATVTHLASFSTNVVTVDGTLGYEVVSTSVLCHLTEKSLGSDASHGEVWGWIKT